MENMDIFQNIPDPAMNYDGGYGDIQDWNGIIQ